MAKRTWSDSDLEKLRSSESHRELARKLGKSYSSIQCARRRLGISQPVLPARKHTTYEADKAGASGEAAWQRRYEELDRKYRRALHENSVVDQVVAEILSVAPRSYSPLPPVVSGRKSSGSAQSAVLLLSDTHVGLRVRPDQTLGFGEYSFPIFLNRLKYLEESVLSILKNHTTAKTDELVVAMLGDMLDGALMHGAEAKQRNTLFAQFYGAGHALAQFLRNIAPHVPKIRIKTVVGNHPRWQNQKHTPTDNRYSNLDMFLYALIEALTKDIKNIEWSLDCQPFSIFDVKGWIFHAAHGDHLRGGDKALGIPNHAVGREVSMKTQLFAKHGLVAPHYYIMGHLHRDIRLPHATGDVTVNGGFPGLDTYALTGNFNPVDPTQRFFFIHPKYGKTAEYNLSLKFAEVTAKAPYTIPSAFPLE